MGVNIVEGTGLVGELLSWIGFGFGILSLFIALAGQAHDGGWEAITLRLLRVRGGVSARWDVSDGYYERLLTEEEHAQVREKRTVQAFRSRRNPSVVRLQPYRTTIRGFKLAGSVLILFGFIGFGLSLLPLFM